MSNLNGSIKVAGADIVFEFDIRSEQTDLTNCVVRLWLRLPDGAIALRSTAPGDGLTRITNTQSLQVIRALIPGSLTANRKGRVLYEFEVEAGGRISKEASYQGGFNLTSSIVASGQTPIPIPAPTPSGVQFERTFTEADLSVAGVLPVTHNLNSYPSAIAVWTNTGSPIQPDSVSYTNGNAIAITLDSFRPLPGTWRLSIGV